MTPKATKFHHLPTLMPTMNRVPKRKCTTIRISVHARRILSSLVCCRILPLIANNFSLLPLQNCIQNTIGWPIHLQFGRASMQWGRTTSACMHCAIHAKKRRRQANQLTSAVKAKEAGKGGAREVEWGVVIMQSLRSPPSLTEVTLPEHTLERKRTRTLRKSAVFAVRFSATRLADESYACTLMRRGLGFI